MFNKIYPVIMISLLLGSIFLSNVSAVNVSLVDSIGYHEFDYNKNDKILESKGSFRILNQESEKVVIKLYVSNDIHGSDLDINGEPRKHKVNNYVYFYPLESTDWLEFEDDRIIIPPNTVVFVNYTIRIPMGELPSFINSTNGFLGYVKFKPEQQNSSTGASITIEYTYKFFMVFKGDFDSFPMLYVIIGIVILLSLIFIISMWVKKEKVKHL